MISGIRKSMLAALLAVAGWRTAQAQPPTILVWGDSLSAGYGLDAGTGWVSLLEARLRQQGRPWHVVNGSVSGETSSGGLARLPKALSHARPRIVLLELGANDGLRGTPLGQLRSNLSHMIEQSRAAGAQTLLFDMRLPTNFGPAYGAPFHALFAGVAQSEHVPMVPFWLGPIARDPDMFQADGLHPNAQAQPKLLEAVWPSLEPLLKTAVPAASASRPPA
jgi:acyl-CoA thioesterase-1